jgi:DNA-binding response OmpR family regulator
MTTKLELLLLVEDDDIEAQAAINVVRAVSANIAIVRQTISDTALQYLRQVQVSPQLILFDIGLPEKTDGIKFIQEMRKIKPLEAVPIVILTGIALDIARAHAANVAAGYIVKPVELERLRELFKQLGFET